ncbi:MAG: 2-amino-4-hydroxy-6-hydroxymethyldihydropteridine diphosphokinase [Bradymonadales bacterium]|nr:2-amino-4-hydroxy-6-hydroxymethyldihydropteridine diphosphokinase [Bradymonadales bacterium]
MDQSGYVGLGSNLGNRLGFLLDAASLLCTPKIWVTSVSQLYQTPPMHVTTQPPFLNAAVSIRTSLSPHDLLDHLHDIEHRLGRRRTLPFGPRTIDLDILLWGERGQLVHHSPSLDIPHPRLPERAFALLPLADLAGDLLHPILGRTIRQLAEQADQTGIQLVDSPLWPPPLAVQAG